MALLPIALAAVSLGSKIYSGYQQKKALREEGYAQMEQGDILYKEAQRDANIVRRQGEQFAQKQSLQYVASGIALGGSALITMRQTRLYAEEKAQAVERRGLAIRDLASRKFDIAENEGDAAMISGFLEGTSSVLSMFWGD